MAFLGQDGFQWGIGVVEDRFDPKQLGRVRVRRLGLHTEDKSKILTQDLPWSEVMLPATATSMSGVGQGGALVEGTWVIGFAKDQDLQNWVIMGVLPGENTTTALTAGPYNSLGANAWAKYRGDYKEFLKDYSTEIEGASTKLKDYEKGFHDPTVDQRNIPHPPSRLSSVNHTGSASPPKWEDPGIPGTYGGRGTNSGDPRILDWDNDCPIYGYPPLDKDDKRVPTWTGWIEYLKPTAQFEISHSDTLHQLYRTTRRLTADYRWVDPDKKNWTDFGTFRWPDTYTYSKKEGTDTIPEFIPTEKETTRLEGNREDGEKGRVGVIISTGYLEPEFWSENRAYGSKLDIQIWVRINNKQIIGH